MKTSLMVCYEVGNGRALAIGRVRDPRMIREAAAQAISEKRREARRLGSQDQTLGLVAVEELGNMRRTFEHLIPDFKA